jgi:hypothetical protein
MALNWNASHLGWRGRQSEGFLCTKLKLRLFPEPIEEANYNEGVNFVFEGLDLV